MKLCPISNVYVQYPVSNVLTQASEYQKQNLRQSLTKTKPPVCF